MSFRWDVNKIRGFFAHENVPYQPVRGRPITARWMDSKTQRAWSQAMPPTSAPARSVRRPWWPPVAGAILARTRAYCVMCVIAGLYASSTGFDTVVAVGKTRMPRRATWPHRSMLLEGLHDFGSQ
jgi:hypothetical protein